MFPVEDLVRCKECKRRLGVDLFIHADDFSFPQPANCFFPRNQRNQRSVNNTFLSHEILAGADAIDPIIYYSSVAGEIASVVGHGLDAHTSTRWILRITVISERMVDDILQEARFNFRACGRFS